MSPNQVLIIEGVPGAEEHTLTPDDPRLAVCLPEAASLGGQVVVCGGSATGIEAATEFAESYPGLHVSLVTRSVLGAALRQSFRGRGVEILDQLEVVGVSEHALHFDGGRPMPFDVAVWTLRG